MLVNLDNGRTLADNLRIASSFWSRFIGLMGRSCLTAGEGILLMVCPSIHTFFMRFPIDVAYLDCDMRVVAIREGVKPWRMLPGVPSGAHTLELPEGTLRATATSIGQKLEVSASSRRRGSAGGTDCDTSLRR